MVTASPADAPPTIAEMRRVATYMAETLGLHSAAGKLLAKADYLQKVVDALIAYRTKEEEATDG